MPESCADKILEKSGTDSPDHLQKPDSETDTSLEFRAEIIPYDTCGNSNSPIVACSGDDMHIIFSIPKKNFRKLAAAVLGRLGYDSDEETPENSETSDQSDHCELAKSGESSLASNFEVKDHSTNDMNGDSARNEGDVSESDPKSYESIDSFSKYKEANTCVKSIELNGKLFSNGAGSLDIEASSKESSSDFRPDFASSNRSLFANNYPNYDVEESSKGIDSVMHKNDISRKLEETECDNCNAKSNIKESSESEPEQHASNPEQNSEGDGTKISGDHEDVNLSAYSLDISNEDCPELKTAWPDIHSYIKAEEIPVEELKSFESSGILTKYYKLNFLKEMVVIKVSSSTDVFIDALKYNLSADPKCESFSEDSGTCNNKEGLEETSESVVSKFSLVTDVSNTQEDIITKISEIKCVNELKDKERDCMQKAATEINALFEGNEVESSEAKSLEPDSRTLLTPNTQPNCMNETSEIKESTVCDSEDILVENASNVRKCKFDVDKTEYKMLEEQFADLEVRKMLSIKIEQKLEESNVNIPGESPLERLRFSLNDSLKKTIEFEANKQTETEELVTGPSGNLSKELKNKIKSLDTSNESEFQIQEHLKVNSEDKYATEVSLKVCDSSEAVNLPGKNLSHDSKNLSADAVKEVNAQLNSENKTIGDISSEDKSVENLKEDEDAVETSLLNYQDGISLSGTNASLEETSTEKSESHLSTKDNFSREIELTSDDHEDSGIEVLNTCKQLENTNESKSHEQSTNVGTFLVNEIEINKCKDDNDVFRSSKNVITKGSSEQFIEDCQEEARVKHAKLEGSKNTLEESEILNISGTNSGSFGKSFSFEENLNISKIVHDLEVSENAVEQISEQNEYTKEHEEPGNSSALNIDEVSHSSILENPENEEKQSATFESEQTEELKEAHSGEIKTETIFEKLAKDERTKNVETDSVEFESPLKCPEKSFVDKSSDSAESSLVLDDNVDDEKPLESSCISNGDHLMETTVEADAESVSEGCDFESDDVKSVASESDDSKDSEKNISVRKVKSKKSSSKVDEVDCAPTRVRTKKIPSLSKDVIPENAEVKNVTSKARSSNLNVTSKTSGKTSPVGRSLRSKSLDPSPEQSKISHDKKQGSKIESGVNRRTRATTPEVISKKDIKTTVRSSPRKLTRSATTEPSSASKVQSTKTGTADGGSKSRSNLDSSVLNSKRSKRGSKD